MPIVWSFLPSHRAVFVRHTGKISDSEFIEAYRRLYTSSDWKPGYCELSDARKADVSQFSPSTLQALGTLTEDAHAGAGPPARTAVLAGHDVTFGLARMYEFLTEGSSETFAVFRDTEEALTWLGLGEEFSREARKWLDAAEDHSAGEME